MNTKLTILLLFFASVLLLVRCKSCNCGFQPPKAPKVYNQAFRHHK